MRQGDRAYAAQEMEHEAFVPVADFGGAGWGLRQARSVERVDSAGVIADASPEAYGTLAQVMRGIPFPNSNIIFDTQTKDPAAPTTGIDEQHRGGRRGNRGVFQRLSRMAAGGKQRNCGG